MFPLGHAQNSMIRVALPERTQATAHANIRYVRKVIIRLRVIRNVASLPVGSLPADPARGGSGGIAVRERAADGSATDHRSGHRPAAWPSRPARACLIRAARRPACRPGMPDPRVWGHGRRSGPAPCPGPRHPGPRRARACAAERGSGQGEQGMHVGCRDHQLTRAVVIGVRLKLPPDPGQRRPVHQQFGLLIMLWASHQLFLSAGISGLPRRRAWPVPCHNSHTRSELVFSVVVRLLSGTR
jgi:hypothetical protein